MMKNLAEKERTGGTKTPGYMFSKDDYLAHVWLRADLVSRPTPMDFFLRGEELSRLHLAKLEVSHLRLTQLAEIPD